MGLMYSKYMTQQIKDYRTLTASKFVTKYPHSKLMSVKRMSDEAYKITTIDRQVKVWN
jgi:hypothetical protein